MVKVIVIFEILVEFWVDMCILLISIFLNFVTGWVLFPLDQSRSRLIPRLNSTSQFTITFHDLFNLDYPKIIFFEFDQAINLDSESDSQVGIYYVGIYYQ